MYYFRPQTEVEKTLWYRSEMNKRQFSALSHRLTNADIVNEILNNNYFLNKVSKASNYSNIDVSQWLRNSWNTESILAQNLSIIHNTNQSFCMQWAFPQAYYAVFGSILAMYKSIGYTETSHTAVLRKYCSLMTEGKLPESISITCDGIEKEFTYNNIVLPKNTQSHMELDIQNNETIDHHICQFLRATRKLRLQEKAPTMNFKKKNGEKRQKLNKENWLQVSKAIGPTSILDFLYRKRIKGNYQDIETYNCPYFKGEEVLTCLINVVSRINLVNEIYIAKAIGMKDYKEMANYQLCQVFNESLKNRMEICTVVVSASRKH